MEPTPHVSSRPLAVMTSSSSTPLTEIEVYRPGPYFALTILLVPVAAALIGTAISLFANGTVPVWMPFLVFLWLPLLPLVWLVMQSVRTNPYGIAAGRPWRTWHEIPWLLIERVEQVGPVIRIFSSNGQQLILIPRLLRDGKRLRRQFFLRLPAHVFAGSLAQEGESLLVNGIHTTPEGGLAGTLRAQPRTLWRLAPIGISCLAVILAVIGVLNLPVGAAVSAVVICVIIALASLLVYGWMAQSVTVSDAGIRARWELTRRTREMTWEQIQFIEHSSRQALLRFRGETRIICAGPALFPTAQRDLMRAFLHEYCVKRGVPIVRRTRLLWPAP